MTVSYFVRYDGALSNPAAFEHHYAGPHADILRAFPGIGSLVLHRPVDWRDPAPVVKGESSLLAQMVFPSAEALNRALASDARARAREDFANFPAFEGSVTHQAMSAEILF